MGIQTEVAQAALDLMGKTVLVTDSATGQCRCVALVQLVPGLPMIGFFLAGKKAKNWMTTPVVCMFKATKSGQMDRVYVTAGKLVIATQSGQRYLVQHQDVASGFEITNLLTADVFADIDTCFSATVEVTVDIRRG